MVAIPMVCSWNREISPFLSIFGWFAKKWSQTKPFVKQSRDVSEVEGTNYSCNMVYLSIHEWFVF